MEGLAGNTANDLRVKERDAILKNFPDIKLMDSVPGGWDQAQARQVMTGMIAAHPKIDAVLTQDVMVEGEMLAFESSGRPLPLITGDYTHSFLKKWKSKDGMEFDRRGQPSRDWRRRPDDHCHVAAGSQTQGLGAYR